MSELIEDIRDDIKREDFIKIWQRYGKLIIGCSVSFIVVITAYLYWQHQKTQTKIANAMLYEKIILNTSDPSVLTKSLQELSEKDSKGYHLLAELTKAGLSNDVAFDLKKISEDLKIEKDFRDISLVLSALADLDGPNPQAILHRLEPFMTSASPYKSLAQEIMGYAHMRLGHGEKAQKIFYTLTQDQTAPPSLKIRAKAMLDTLGRVS